jgi:superfamily II DNA or RNA helicase
MPNSALASSPFFREWTLKSCRSAQGKKVPAPHQAQALAKLNAWYRDLSGKEDGGILVLPTGGGKTFTAAHFLAHGPLSDGYKVLWLAHTHHLLEQAFYGFDGGLLGGIREPRAKLALRVVSGTPGHFHPRDIKPSDDIIIATLQTLTNAHREQHKALLAFLASAKGKLFIVFDEAHHAPAPSYRKLLQALCKDHAPLLGLTATPTYSDEAKKGWLKKLFPQGILAQAKAGDLMAQGVLAQPTFVRADTAFTPQFDTAEFQKWLGTYRDLPEDIIDSLALNSERNAMIAQTYVENRAKYGKTIIFTDRWHQCEAIVEALRKHKVRADAVYSHIDASLETVDARNRRDRDENGKVLDQFRKNELDVLVNVRMLTEGTDIPDAQTVFLTRQTTSQILLTQMVGRALRGPKFGGTAKAFIVSFIDSWQQGIRFAEYDPLAEGAADESVRPSMKRPPLLLVSIELVKQLARRMDSGINVLSGQFLSLMPVGWYRVTFDTCPENSDEIEPTNQLVLVFEDERKGFETLLKTLLKSVPKSFEDERVTMEDQRPTLDSWRERYLGEATRIKTDLQLDLFALARHIGQGHGVPEFFPFAIREEHDLDAVARQFITDDLGSRAIQEQLWAEYSREDRFWGALFPRFDQFRSTYDASAARLLSPAQDLADPDSRCRNEPISAMEPDEAIKRQVKARDGNCCVCCGAVRTLQVDHIVPSYHGGPHTIANLQTLCGVCNRTKRTRTLRFKSPTTPLTTAPKDIEVFSPPRRESVGDRDQWEHFIRRTINFAFQCGAVAKVTIGGRGETYYHWSVELNQGLHPSWLKPHIKALFARIGEARTEGGKPELSSLTILAPGEKAVQWPPHAD